MLHPWQVRKELVDALLHLRVSAPCGNGRQLEDGTADHLQWTIQSDEYTMIGVYDGVCVTFFQDFFVATANKSTEPFTGACKFFSAAPSIRPSSSHRRVRFSATGRTQTVDPVMPWWFWGPPCVLTEYAT